MIGAKVLFMVSSMVLAVVAPARADVWWTTAGGATEEGKVQELTKKRKVFLNVVFTTTEADIDASQVQTNIRLDIARAIAAYNGLQLVAGPDDAELAITVIASQTTNAQLAGVSFAANQVPGLQTPLDMAVLVRGAMQRDGTYSPRVLWSMSSPDVQGRPAPAAVFAIDSFIDQLKKARGQKKSK